MADVISRILTPLELLWRWRSLASVAARTSNAAALLAGTASIAVIAMVAGWALAAGLNEPVASYSRYLSELARPPPILLVLAAVLIAFAWWCVLFAAMRAGRAGGTADVLEARAAALVPVMLLAVAAVWAPLRALAIPAARSFDVLAGKPPWVLSPWLRAGSSGWTLLMLLLVDGACVARALNQLGRVAAERACGACGYSLQGLAAATICPECGRVLARDPVLHPGTGETPAERAVGQASGG